MRSALSSAFRCPPARSSADGPHRRADLWLRDRVAADQSLRVLRRGAHRYRGGHPPRHRAGRGHGAAPALDLRHAAGHRLIMLAGIYYGAMYGGSTTSILVNV